MYAISYLYLLNDFLQIVRDSGDHKVLFTSYWLERWAEAYNPARETDDGTRLVDCHEFAYMGPFGIGYKLVVQGRECVEKSAQADNVKLFRTAEVVRTHAMKYWVSNIVTSNGQNPLHKLVVRIGVLCRWQPLDYGLVPLKRFLENKAPSAVPVLWKVMREKGL